MRALKHGLSLFLFINKVIAMCIKLGAEVSVQLLDGFWNNVPKPFIATVVDLPDCNGTTVVKTNNGHVWVDISELTAL